MSCALQGKPGRVHLTCNTGADTRGPVSARVADTAGLRERGTMAQILWIILLVIVAIWFIGLLADIAGSLIHLLLVVALIILIYNLVVGRRA